MLYSQRFHKTQELSINGEMIMFYVLLDMCPVKNNAMQVYNGYGLTLICCESCQQLPNIPS